jgi:DNA-binding IclR family transcriptional regulator
MDDNALDLQPLHKNHGIYFVPGLRRGLLTLEMIAAAQKPMNVSEIAAELGVTRSSAFRLVYTLHHMGFLDEVPQTSHPEL